jgi:hypothetical protein
MRQIRCLTCDTVITSTDRIVGCVCDSDAPTWCALDGDRVLALSHAEWREVIE